MDEQELENPENWDLENAEVRPPVRKSRVVVSVAFRGDDFDLVEEGAQRMGAKVSTFIRDAAVSRAEALEAGNVVFFNQEPTVTMARWGFVPASEEDVSSLAKEPA